MREIIALRQIHPGAISDLEGPRRAALHPKVLNRRKARYIMVFIRSALQSVAWLVGFYFPDLA
jgi:hypothetical protein